MANKPERANNNSNENREGIAQSQRTERRFRRGSGQTADWGNADPGELFRAVVAVTGRKCAIQLGYTTDGGSLVIRIVGDGEPYNEYVRPTESLSDFLNALSMDFEKS